MESLARKEFHHEDAIEDHWMNATNDYDVCIRDDCRMNLYLAEKALQLNILEEIRQQDSKELLDPLFNSNKIGERPIMNAEVNMEEADDINHRVRHAFKMMKDCIKKPFQLDPIPDTVIFHTKAHLEKGRGKKLTIPTFAAQSPIRLETVYQIDHLVGYYHPLERKKKNKRKRSSPQRVETRKVEVQAPPQ